MITLINNTAIHLVAVNVLQMLIELESEYGVLPPYTPVIDDVLTFMKVAKFLVTNISYKKCISYRLVYIATVCYKL